MKYSGKAARKEMKVDSKQLIELLEGGKAQRADIRFKEEYTACPHKDRATVAMVCLRAKGVKVELDEVEDSADIMSYGVMPTPGVVIDGTVVHVGGVPGRKKVEGWPG